MVKHTGTSTRRYQVGNLVLQITAPGQMRIPQNLETFCLEDHHFMISAGQIQIDYVLNVTSDLSTVLEDCLKQRTGNLIQREDLTVFPVSGGECRFLKFKESLDYYGISLQKNETTYQIWFDERVSDLISIDTVFWSAFQLERQAMCSGSLILHSAYIVYKRQAILFSAASGVGKSTQASLWETYRGARVINGDRSLLTFTENGWQVSGWPVCGSSQTCRNESYPLHAIVMLAQAKENRCHRLRGMDAFRLIFPQITVNGWNRTFQTQAMDQLERLLQSIPVYLLECDISEDAVKCLERYL